MAHLKHSGGIVETYLELGFDAAKYFEITASGTAQMISFTPPARRLTLRNTSSTDPFYFNITGSNAVASAGTTPGDNIKVGAQCIFEMDFDILTDISFVTTGAEVPVEGLLGWKGVATE